MTNLSNGDILLIIDKLSPTREVFNKEIVSIPMTNKNNIGTILKFSNECDADMVLKETICTHAASNAVMMNFLKKWLDEKSDVERGFLVADMKFYAEWLNNPRAEIVSC